MAVSLADLRVYPSRRGSDDYCHDPAYAHPPQHLHTMMMSGGMPPTAGGMGVMGVMGSYLSGGREYLEGGTVGVDPSVWVPPFWDEAHLTESHLHDPSIAEAAHMGEPPTMGDVGPTDIMDAFPPQQHHGKATMPSLLTL